MLEARFATNVLEKSLAMSDMLAYAIVSLDGTVLESRERRTEAADLFPQHLDVSENFQVSSKLQTKIYGLFASDFWRKSSPAEWLGAEAHERRLVIYPLGDQPVLLLAVGRNSDSWGSISRHAKDVVDQFAKGS